MVLKDTYFPDLYNALLCIQRDVRSLALSHGASPKSNRPDEQEDNKFWQNVYFQRTRIYRALTSLYARKAFSSEDNENVKRSKELIMSIFQDLNRISPAVRPQDFDDAAKDIVNVAKDVVNVAKTAHGKTHVTTQATHKNPIVSAMDVQPGLGLDSLTPLIGLLFGVIGSKIRKKA